MACFDCEDCKRIRQKMPYCDIDTENVLYLGTVVADQVDPPFVDPIPVIIRMTKPNGAVFQILADTFGDDNLQVRIRNSDFPDGRFFGPESGLVKVEVFYNAPEQTLLELEDPNGVTATCLLLEFGPLAFAETALGVPQSFIIATYE